MGLYATRLLIGAATIAVLPAIPAQWQVVLICMISGVFGGGIIQFLTWDTRRPTWRFLIGDLASSSVMGMGVHVAYRVGMKLMHQDADATLLPGAGDPIEMYFACIIAGATGSGGFLMYVNNYKPHLLRPPKKMETEVKVEVECKS